MRGFSRDDIKGRIRSLFPIEIESDDASRVLGCKCFTFISFTCRRVRAGSSVHGAGAGRTLFCTWFPNWSFKYNSVGNVLHFYTWRAIRRRAFQLGHLEWQLKSAERENFAASSSLGLLSRDFKRFEMDQELTVPHWCCDRPVFRCWNLHCNCMDKRRSGQVEKRWWWWWW